MPAAPSADPAESLAIERSDKQHQRRAIDLEVPWLPRMAFLQHLGMADI